MAPSRFIRLVTLVLAAIQFAAPAVTSVAEGAYSRRVIDPSAHVEEHGQKDCVPPHAADCAVCRYLVDHVGDIHVPALGVAIVTTQAEPVAPLTLNAWADRDGFEARGPPAIAG
jgi:hypothetical protein